MQRAVRIGVFALAALFVVLIGLSVVYAVDGRRHSGRVARRVQLAGIDVSGLNKARLAAAVAEVERAYAGGKVTVEAKSGGFTTTTKALGLTVDRAATTKAALGVGRGGSAIGRFTGWVGAIFSARKAPVQIDVQPASAYREVALRDASRTPAIEPALKLEGSKIVAVPGTPGKGIDPADVLRELPDAADGGVPITVTVDRGTVKPRFTEADAEALAARAMDTVTKPLALSAGEDGANVPVAKLRSWVTAKATDKGLELGLDEKRVLDDLPRILPDAGKAPVETRFSVTGDGVAIIAGSPGTTCCAEDAPAMLEAALFGGGSGDGKVEVPLKSSPPKRTVEEARELGIKELVSTYTTKHPANQPRVTNIHKIADIVRGEVIEPGEIFSVNGFVGKRTVERGFVVDHVIEDGRFGDDVGGGISQFATTLFNAAFFGGLGLTEYQNHSLYISRYPYGREATLSFPKPDLRIKNTTPYGVLIWPTYTGTTITVNLYSTKHLEVTQSNQTKSPRGQSCTSVRTERTIKFLDDGRTTKDNINATYRGAEGLSCDKPLSASTTTTASTVPPKPTSSTAPPPASTTAPPAASP